jgi:FAD synthase
LAPPLDQSGKIRLETHLLDTYIENSPRIAKVEFIKRIRGEFTFKSIEELKVQIASDVAYAKNYFRI